MKTDKQTPTQSQQVKPNPTDRRKEIGQSQDEGSQSHSSKLMKQTLTADTIQTPTQIASEISDGCKKIYIGVDSYGDKTKFICTGNTLNSKFYCKKCLIKILAYRTAWEGEFEDWKWVANTCNDSRVKQYGIKKVSELTSALKILEGEQK